MTTLARRVVVAVVAIPVALGVVRLGGWTLVAALAVLAVQGTAELFRLARARDVLPLTWLGATAAAAMPAAMLVLVTDARRGGWIGLTAVGWALTVMAAAVARRPPDRAPLAAVAVTLFAPIYTGLLPSFVLVLRQAAPERDPWAATWLVFLPLAVVWACDSVAMAAGALVGGPKFCPGISPKKTWAGTIAGSASGLVVGPLFGWLILNRVGVTVSPMALAVFGLVVATVGQVGDLAESLFKREAGVKDSGVAFPGHGGVLDRLDSLYWALPTSVALLAAWGTV